MNATVEKSNKPKVLLGPAEKLANRIFAALSHTCERIEIAGSIRRRKEHVGDIEIVAIPKRKHDMLGDPDSSMLDDELDMLISEGRLRKVKRGDRYGQFELVGSGVPGFKLDLFITDPERWGVIYTIRTGSSNFSKRIVKPEIYGGYLPEGLRVNDGLLWADDGEDWVVVHTPEETDYFEYLTCGWIEPQDRL